DVEHVRRQPRCPGTHAQHAAPSGISFPYACDAANGRDAVRVRRRVAMERAWRVLPRARGAAGFAGAPDLTLSLADAGGFVLPMSRQTDGVCLVDQRLPV